MTRPRKASRAYLCRGQRNKEQRRGLDLSLSGDSPYVIRRGHVLGRGQKGDWGDPIC